ncbi:MAG TPA: EF-hand domain-containing protein [Steroidobacteraceae bacterium]|nr:EF-hand domain-containing protein [Steroidobacteraceae bacterium]
MSSVSMGGGCSAAQYSGLHTSQAGGSDRIQKLFGKLDVNGDDAIDQSELQSFVDAIGAKTGTSGIDAKSLLTSLDTDGNGSVSASELKENAHTLFDQLRNQLMGSKAESSSSQPDISRMFSSFDANGDGSISADEFKTAIQSGPGDKYGAQGKGPAPPHDAGFGRMLESLLAQYGSNSDSSTSLGSSVNVAA